MWKSYPDNMLFPVISTIIFIIKPSSTTNEATFLFLPLIVLLILSLLKKPTLLNKNPEFLSVIGKFRNLNHGYSKALYA